jgi:spore maturation protein CgeB
MNILIIQEKGRHEKNQMFREALSLQRAFDKTGDACTVWGLHYSNYQTDINNLILSHDAVLLLENYDTTSWIPDLSAVKVPKLFWSIDSHCNLDAHLNIVQKNKINTVLCSIESDQIHFAKHGVKTYYLPNAVDSDLVKPIINIDKKYDIGFCGTLFPDRDYLISQIESKLNIAVHKDILHIGYDMVKAINTYNIHLNKTISKDINYRVFETLACQTTLLTNHTENIDKFFTDMQDVVIYRTLEELLEKIQFLLNNRDLMLQISESGYKKVLSNHTYNHRVNDIKKIIGSI